MVLLFTLLPVLAILQYHWIGQLSMGEKMRMEANVKLSAERFAEDFDKELTIPYNFFHRFDMEQEDFAKKLTEASGEVRQRLTNPDLIKKIYVVNINSGQQSVLLGLSLSDSSLVPQEWPEQFLFLKKRLESKSPTYLQTLVSLSHAPVLGENSFIVIHMLPNAIINFSLQKHDSFLLIELDKNTLVDEFLPQLTRQYFSVNDEILYNVAILKENNPDTLFYNSTTKNGEYFLKDALYSVDIGNWRSEKFMIAAARIVENDSIVSNETRKIQVKSDSRISIEMIQKDTNMINESFNFLISNIAPWRLYVKYADGDLESVISQSRIQNLMASYTILLFLGISIYLLFSGFKRSQKISRQQVEFVAGLTHELRTPLASIRSAAENLKDGIVKSPEQLKKYAQIIYDEDVRLTQMIEQSLQLAGLANGSKRVHENINLKELFEEIINETDQANKHVILKTEEECSIKGDAVGLKIIVRNLLSNALKYSQGKNTVEAGFYFDKEKNCPVLFFKDNGNGIDPDDEPHIFDPFYRGKNATENHVQGLGIGLSLVKKIVNDHNGRIELQNVPGKGCTFKVYIPPKKEL